MIYFLDFDRTLYDTDAHLASLPDEPGVAAFRDELAAVVSARRDETLTGGSERLAAWDKLSAAAESGALSYAPGALEKYLYQDVPEFLRAMGNEAIVITYGNPVWQKTKVESALANIVRTTVLYTGSVHKAEYLSTWPGYYGQEAVMVDDRPAELEALGARYPALKLFQMKRDGKEGDGRWPVIRSLAELP